jgi:type VI secretion system protein ImpH
MLSPIEQFKAEPWEFDFFSAMRILERAYPDRKPVGLEFSPFDEIVRMRPHMSMAFPPSQIVEYLQTNDQRPVPILTTTFFGLYGISGVLPTHYTQMLMDIVRDIRGPERRSLRDFFDLFNHRFISLFYRSWEKYRFYVPYERGDSRGPDANADTFTLALRSMIGIGTPGLVNRLEVRGRKTARDVDTVQWGESAVTSPILAKIDDLALLYYSGFFVQRPRNASNLQAILADYFGLPVEVQLFRGQWLDIPVERQTQLGMGGMLGIDTVAGERTWNVESRFRIRLGPLRYPQFANLIPDPEPQAKRKLFFLVAQMVRLFVGPEQDFDVQLVLSAKEIPASQLVENPADGPGPHLGWNMWLISKTPKADADDAVFEGEWVTNLA